MVQGMSTGGSDHGNAPGGPHPPAQHVAFTRSPSGALTARSNSPGSWAPPQYPVGADPLQVEIQRRQAAEARVKELEAVVSRLQARVAALEGGKRGVGVHSGENGVLGSKGKRGDSASPLARSGSRAGVALPAADDAAADLATDDAIDKAIRAYLERNADFPVSIQKVAPNHYTFGDRGTVYVTQRGDHVVVRVGGGFKSLQVFMDERALMVTRDAAGALSERTSSQAATRTVSQPSGVAMAMPYQMHGMQGMLGMASA